MRINANVKEVKWAVLDELMATGSEMYNALEEAKAADRKRSPARAGLDGDRRLRKAATTGKLEPW